MGAAYIEHVHTYAIGTTPPPPRLPTTSADQPTSSRETLGGNARRGIPMPGVRQHPAVGTTGGLNPAPHSWAGAPGGWAMETFGQTTPFSAQFSLSRPNSAFLSLSKPF